MKKLVFQDGIYTVLRPLYYLCKLFGLASYSYVADRRNNRVTPDYGYLNYIFTAIWLVLYTVGFPVDIFVAYSDDTVTRTFFIAWILFIISLYTSSVVGVVWLSIIKRKRFLEIIENISEVDNKVRHTLREETHMNRSLILNIISEIVLLSTIIFNVIIYDIYEFTSKEYNITKLRVIISTGSHICNTLILFQFLYLVFMVKQRYNHFNKHLSNCINGTFSRPKGLMKENGRYILSHRTVDHVNITPLYVSCVGHFEVTLKQTDIHLLRQIYSEMYDITCLINDAFGFPILANVCWIMTGVLCCLYELLIDFNVWEVTDAVYAITYSLLFFKITFFCHTATNEARTSRILVQKLLLGGNCRNECVKELKNFSLQLQVMEIEYTACGFFSLNLSLFAGVVSVIASYITIMVQIK
jgi:hypothetical protein